MGWNRLDTCVENYILHMWKRYEGNFKVYAMHQHVMINTLEMIQMQRRNTKKQNSNHIIKFQTAADHGTERREKRRHICYTN